MNCQGILLCCFTEIRTVVRMIGPCERQNEIWQCMCQMRQVTAEYLATRFGTSTRTIYRDVQKLMRTSETLPLSALEEKGPKGSAMTAPFEVR